MNWSLYFCNADSFRECGVQLFHQLGRRTVNRSPEIKTFLNAFTAEENRHRKGQINMRMVPFGIPYRNICTLEGALNGTVKVKVGDIFCPLKLLIKGAVFIDIFSLNDYNFSVLIGIFLTQRRHRPFCPAAGMHRIRHTVHGSFWSLPHAEPFPIRA